MKNINALSLFLLLTSTQTYSAANPMLGFILASKVTKNLNSAVVSANDNAAAKELLAIMNASIDSAKNLENDLNNVQGTFLYNEVPLDEAKIEQENKNLAAREAELKKEIDRLSGNIKSYEKGGITAWERKKVNNRREDRRKHQDEITANLAKIAANNTLLKKADNVEAIAEANKNAINLQIEQNELNFDEALETYIVSFGQVYKKEGTLYGSSIVISSDYDRNIAITPKNYNELVATLNKADKQFGSNIEITLPSEEVEPATIKEVANYVGNMPLASSAYASYAKYTLAATVGTAAAIAGTAIAYNLYQGKEWNDMEDVSNVYSEVAAQANIAGQAAYDKAIAAKKSISDAGEAAIKAAKESEAGQALIKAKSQVDAIGNAAYEKAVEAGVSVAQATQEASNAVANSEFGQAAASVYDATGQYLQDTYSAAVDSQAGQALAEASEYAQNTAQEYGQAAYDQAINANETIAAATQIGNEIFNSYYDSVMAQLGYESATGDTGYIDSQKEFPELYQIPPVVEEDYIPPTSEENNMDAADDAMWSEYFGA